jgi:hypothetical protein
MSERPVSLHDVGTARVIENHPTDEVRLLDDGLTTKADAAAVAESSPPAAPIRVLDA